MLATTIAGSTVPNDRVVRTLRMSYALEAIKEIKQQQAEWNDERATGWLNYCQHGTYIGDPYGADYMCGACESGTSVYEIALAQAYERLRRERSMLSTSLLAVVLPPDAAGLMCKAERTAFFELLLSLRESQV